MQATDYNKKRSPKALLNLFPRQHLVLAGGLGACLICLLALYPSPNAQAKRHSQPLSLTITETEQVLLADVTTPMLPDFVDEPIEPSWHTETVKSGDNLSLIFQRAGLSDRKLFAFMASNKATKSLTRIHPGQTLDFQIEDGALQALRYKENRLNSQLFERSDDTFSHTDEQRIPEVRVSHKQATINGSLFLAAQKAGLDANLIMEVANIFGWDIDFALDIRKGDSFKVVFEEKYLDGKKFTNGNILSAEFTNQGKKFQALRYTDSKGSTHYYTPTGETMRKEFLRTPVDIGRISSHFNLKRKHPVLNRIRAHKGTDYAAARGTPIKAAGDGKVVHAGRKGGYGNTVIIQHGQTYKTLYAHMKNFGRGVRSGSRVKQGQIIGYVGTTGLSTGPHLHYEFYVNGAVRNPVTVKLPKARSIATTEKARFLTETRPQLAQLENLGKPTLIAQADTQGTGTL